MYIESLDIFFVYRAAPDRVVVLGKSKVVAKKPNSSLQVFCYNKMVLKDFFWKIENPSMKTNKIFNIFEAKKLEKNTQHNFRCKMICYVIELNTILILWNYVYP